MKKLINLIFVAFLASFLIACSSNTSSPEAVAENFIDSLVKSDVDHLLKIIDLGDKELKAGEEEMLRGKVMMMAGQVKSDTESRQGIKSIKATETTLNEDGVQGQVKVEIKFANGTEKYERVRVIKRDGQWKVSLAMR